MAYAAAVPGARQDAMLCATVVRQSGRVAVLTSDAEDIGMLLAGHPRVVVEKV
ncbi:hypothetical protein [Streptomyces ipomoeae]|uniref:hypothetical protein n=1 Tax=Streptomyces ipomoeae TaxID=103232 RepID=UPI0015F0735F|nr:hypothetical protein [Streptomyces ipomoeae]